MRGKNQARIAPLLSLFSAFGVAVLCNIVLLTPASAQASFSACAANLRLAAMKAGISRSVVSEALNVNTPDEKVLRLSKLQPEFKTPIWDYIGYLVDNQRINDGKTQMGRYEQVLRAAEKRFGVDRHVIAAVWGIETDYGRETGDNFLPHALATLYCEGGKRKDFWRGELFAALKLVDRGDVELSKLYGSWAGAFGQTQFIPSTYQRLAVDFDGDGKRDLITSVPDALGSTANFLKQAGWRSGEQWLIEVKVPTGYNGPTGRRNKLSISEWARYGLARTDGKALSGNEKAGLLLPAGPNGPGFLVFRNFDAIYSYNRAESYALAISYLAKRLAGQPALRTPWPTDDPGLTRAQRMELQHLLLAKGYKIGDADGKIGPVTREAIKDVERQLGMPETGRPGTKVYRALGGK